MESLNESNKDSEFNNYECPVCYLIASRPTITPCKHLFCFSCINKIIELEPKCPLCRSDLDKFKPKIDMEIQKQIKETFNKEFLEREKNYEEEEKWLSNIIRKKILFGNTHVIIPDGKPLRSNPQIINNHKWKFFIKLPGKEFTNTYIQKVIIGMDPTFGGVDIKLMKDPFELERVGWGSFDLPIKIHWQKWLKKEPTELNYSLCFEGTGKTKSFFLEFDKSLISKIPSHIK